MAVITGGNVIPGSLDYYGAGAPGVGTAEVQTLTFANITGGTFKLSLEGLTTADITWSATNATLLANVDAALEALPNVGTAGVVTAAGTLTAGIGTMTLTFAEKRNYGPVTVDGAGLVGAGAAITVAETTPGVAPTPRAPSKGATYQDTTNGVLYVMTGTPTVPAWTAQA